MAGYKKAYTSEEDKHILRYIIDKKAFYCIRGNTLWKEMEHEFPDRSWQSLKNRFFRAIALDFSNPSYQLNAVEVKKMQLALLQTSTAPDTTKSTRHNTRERR